MFKAIFKWFVVHILMLEARMVLYKYKPSIIAVTGSVGKTSTKDAVYAGLKNSLYIRKSEKSFNSEVGVPLTILGCDTGWSNPFKWLRNIIEGCALILFPNHYPKWLVLEIGASAPGDIERLLKLIKPDISIITSLPDIPVHVENFKNAKEVIHEKIGIVRALKSDGVLIYNGDDKNIRKEVSKFHDIYALSYGMEVHNDVAASNTLITYTENGMPDGMKFNINEKGSTMPMRIYGRIGQQQVLPIVAAFATARTLALSPIVVSKSIKSECGSLGRMRVLKGFNNTVLIDDTYNSSPIALRAALNTLKKVVTKGRKIAIIGDMLELGKLSDDAHKKAGTQIAGIVDELITIGVHTKLLVRTARSAGLTRDHIHQFGIGESAQAGKFVRNILQKGDVILAKGSQAGIRTERALREILADPLSAKDLLVRQDDAWYTKK